MNEGWNSPMTLGGTSSSPLNIKVHDQDGNEIEGPWQTVDRVDLDHDGPWSSMSKIGTFVNDFSPPPVEEKEREKIYVSDEIEKGNYLNVGDFIYFEEHNPTGFGLKLGHPYEIRRVDKGNSLQQPYSIDGFVSPMIKKHKAYHY